MNTLFDYYFPLNLSHKMEITQLHQSYKTNVIESKLKYHSQNTIVKRVGLPYEKLTTDIVMDNDNVKIKEINVSYDGIYECKDCINLKDEIVKMKEEAQTTIAIGELIGKLYEKNYDIIETQLTSYIDLNTFSENLKIIQYTNLF